jgi:hypothetical protein
MFLYNLTLQNCCQRLIIEGYLFPHMVIEVVYSKFVTEECSFFGEIKRAIYV